MPWGGILPESRLPAFFYFDSVCLNVGTPLVGVRPLEMPIYKPPPYTRFALQSRGQGKPCPYKVTPTVGAAFMAVRGQRRCRGQGVASDLWSARLPIYEPSPYTHPARLTHGQGKPCPYTGFVPKPSNSGYVGTAFRLSGLLAFRTTTRPSYPRTSA